MGQFSVVSSTQKDDVTITIIKNEVEKRFVRIETRKGGHGDGKEGSQGFSSQCVCVYVCICVLTISRVMYIGQGMSTTMAGNYFFVSVDRKMFATDDSVYQAILSRRTSPTCDGPIPYTTYIPTYGSLWNLICVLFCCCG